MLYIPYINDISVDDYLIFAVSVGVSDTYDTFDFLDGMSDGGDNQSWSSEFEIGD